MLVKLGVDISRLNREIRRTLNIVENIHKSITNEEAVVSSTYEGNHMPSSLHYKNDAYDISSHQKTKKVLRSRISLELGPDFDVVSEEYHVHIEYDPK